MEFLTDLFKTGVGYSTINTAKSALAAVVVLPGGMSLGKHPVVTRFMKGVFEQRPSLPRYCATWDASLVLTHLGSFALNDTTLKQLTHKLTVLLCLLTGQRLQTLVALETCHMDLHPDKCVFYIQRVLKTTKPGRHIAPIVLNKYDNRELCIVRHLARYLQVTKAFRTEHSNLLISYRKPHKPVTEDTLARWVKCTLQGSGVNTALFSAHSTRGASTSAAARQGAPLELILKAANWTHAATFWKFYKREVDLAEDRHFDHMILRTLE